MKPNLPIIPQTKNPAAARLDLVNHLLKVHIYNFSFNKPFISEQHNIIEALLRPKS